MNENQFGVILESILSKVNGLAEGQKVMQEAIETRLDNIETDISGLKTDVTGLKTGVAGLKTDVTGLKTDVAGLKTDVARIDQKLDIVIKQTAVLTENVNDHEKRISTLEQNAVSV